MKKKIILVKKKQQQNLAFPGGTVDENSPANAEDMGSIPGPGRLHVTYSNYESPLPRACALQQEMPALWEAWAPQLERSLRSQGEEACEQHRKPAATKTLF